MNTSNAFPATALNGPIFKNKKALATVAGVILVISLFIGVRQSAQEKKNLAASSNLFSAQQLLEKEQKSNGKDGVTSVDQQLSGAIAAFKKVQAEYSGTLAAWEATVQIGNLYLKFEPKSGKAATWFEAAQKAAPSSREKLFSNYSLAFALEEQGKFEDAIRALDSAIALKLPYFKAELALTRARLLLRGGKNEESTKALDQVSKDFANTDMGRKAEQWKAQGTL